MSPARQRPLPGSLVLDHVAHWVPDAPAAQRTLAALGFTVTPFSAQSTGDPPVPAGTGNHCVMLEEGYLEFLAPTADTANAATLRAGIARYVGVHLIAFGTAAPAGDHARLAAAGFAPLEPVALNRPVETAQGTRRASFTVVRTAAGTMAEGRVQFVEQHTPEYLWQPQWLGHANKATALRRVELCVADPAETVSRFARYTGLAPAESDGAPALRTARGALVFRDPAATRARLGVEPPCLPWIAGYALACRDLSHAPAGRETAQGRVVALAEALGGAMLFES
ncbi:MAG: VOC family protein [Proteobacteria bacterium]|nr:VOC family protein [Pseudomonadota bacterium]